MRPTTRFAYLSELWIDWVITSLVFIAWIAALAVLLCFAFSAAAQTNTNVFVAVPVVSTNAPVVIVPLAEKIDKWFEMIQNILIGAGTVIVAILGIWAKIKTTQASVVPVLVKAIEAHGTESLKSEIEQAALRAQVEPALNAAVKGNTAIFSKNSFAPTPVSEPVKVPEVNP